MMVKLVESMGKEAFREGIQEYLKTYAYANATWDDLIQILDSKTEQDLAAFSDVWVNQKGMPIIKFEISDKQLTIHQQDPYQRGLNWPQKFNITLWNKGHNDRSQSDRQLMPMLPFTPSPVFCPIRTGEDMVCLFLTTASIGCWNIGKK